MKVKNIVFSGFAAAILMGIAADASAATQVATKAYVDSLDNVLLAPTGSVVSGVTQEDGKVMSLTTTEFDTEIPEENPSNTTAPTTKAVYDFVTANDTTYTAGSHIAIDNNAIAVDDITSEAAGITDTSTALTTGKAVYEYVTANDDDTTYTGSGYVSIDGDNDITVTNITSEAAGITDTSTALTTGKAVYEYVTANDDDTTYTGSGYVSIDGDNDITVTNITSEAAGITDTSTALTTGKAVYEYVDELTGGVLPQGCENGNCALVKLNGRLQWVDLTTPLQ